MINIGRLPLIVAITDALREDLARELQRPRSMFAVLPDGADAVVNSEFTFELQCPPRVGYAGSLHPGKGADMILDIARRSPELEFHIAGGPIDRLNYYKERAADCPNIVWHGYLPPLDVGRFIQSCDILISPMAADVCGSGGVKIGRWTSPLKIFEYMGSKRPMICSDLPVLREVLQSGSNCLLCPPNDPESWVNALRRLVRMPDLRRALAARAWADLQSRYSWDARVGELSKLLDKSSRARTDIV